MLNINRKLSIKVKFEITRSADESLSGSENENKPRKSGIQF